jgi:putative ABC transport system permease protein
MIQSRYYIGIILIAGILSLPISYYVSRSWLERFAYRIPDSPGEFLLSFLFVSVVTYFTPFVQILKSSGANPVDALRYE